MANTPERLRKVQELFHAALPLEPAARSVFLAEACGPDRELLDEVASLISAHEREGSFIDSPAAQPVAEMLASVRSESYVGQTVGSFRILSQLGRGGMGEVYLAHDSKLGRKVALKLLPEELTRREDLVRRFGLEAKAASGLNHPNIVTVYEIGQTGSSHYIATEYIEGETLRQRFARGRMSLREVLDVVIQAAGALAAAHIEGIVHRDIKPENIMLRPDGYVKVLDFGLAKLTINPSGSSPSSADLEAATLVKMDTEPGALVGTPYYLSPEQARGLNVDARADIFSLGVMTYEMLAGRRPFGGDTTLDALISTIEKEPPPLASCAPGVPAELQRIVSKALRKDREERYQTVKDMWIDLKQLRDELAFVAKLERSSPPESNIAAAVTTPVQQSVVTGSAQAIASSSHTKRWLVPSIVGALIVAAIGIVGVKGWLSSAPVPSNVPPTVVAQRELNYWVTVQKYRDGKPYGEPFRLPGEILFEKDYRVRLHFASPQGHLYIFNEGPPRNGEVAPLNVLFPSPTANNGVSLVASGQTVDIPKQSWFRFDQEEGTEKLWLVWSANAIEELEKTSAFANDKDLGVINSPQVDRSVKAFLSKTQSSSKPIVERDDVSKESRIKANADIVVHILALEHH